MTSGWTTLPAILVWAVSLLLVGLTILPLSKRPWWWIRLWDYPRLQLAAGLIGMAAFQAVVLPWGGAEGALRIVTLACFTWQVFRIWPYTILHRKQVPGAKHANPAESLTILVANVLQDNRRAPDLLALIRQVDPDVILTLETNAWWETQLRPLLETHPFAVMHALENTYGIHLFSRLRLRDAVVRERVTTDIPSVFARVRLRSGRLVDMHCLHPEPPQIGNDVAERDAELLLVAREVAANPRPTIVCGDLNDVAWSHTTRLFQRLSGLLDPRVGRGLYPTFHAEHWFARWPLDHAFHDARFRVAGLRVLPYYGSDHFAICITLCHDPAALAEAEIPEADEDDEAEAEAKIAEGREAAAMGTPPIQD